jgi:hypothetical protein
MDACRARYVSTRLSTFFLSFSTTMIELNGVFASVIRECLKAPDFHPAKAVLSLTGVTRIVDNFFGPARIPVASNL